MVIQPGTSSEFWRGQKEIEGRADTRKQQTETYEAIQEIIHNKELVEKLKIALLEEFNSNPNKMSEEEIIKICGADCNIEAVYQVLHELARIEKDKVWKEKGLETRPRTYH